MTYSTGSGGYGGPPQGPGSQGFGQQPQGYAPSPGQGKGLPFWLNVGVVGLAIVSFFLGFAPFASEDKDYEGNGGLGFSEDSMNFFANISLGVGMISLSALFAAALIAAFSMLPKQEPHDAVVAGLSLTGFVSLLFLMIGLADGVNVGVGLWLVLITSFLQSALAVAVLLFSAGIIKPPQPSQPQFGYYGQGSGYGQALQPGQPPQQSQPQQPYYGSGAPGSAPPGYQQPPSQPQPPQNPW